MSRVLETGRVSYAGVQSLPPRTLDNFQARLDAGVAGTSSGEETPTGRSLSAHPVGGGTVSIIEVIDLRPLGARLGQWWMSIESASGVHAEFPLGADAKRALDNFDEIREGEGLVGGRTYRLFNPEDEQAITVSIP